MGVAIVLFTVAHKFSCHHDSGMFILAVQILCLLLIQELIILNVSYYKIILLVFSVADVRFNSITTFLLGLLNLFSASPTLIVKITTDDLVPRGVTFRLAAYRVKVIGLGCISEEK